MRWVTGLGLGLGLMLGIPVSAEVITDGSLGAQRELPGPDYEIGADLGQQQGRNLFHSFSQFNLLANESANFSGPDSVRYIVGRITGGESSSIAGLLKSPIPGAQLWLFNPAGIEQSGLVEISGGVRVAEAIGLRLKDGGLFAADLESESRLTIASPQTFFFALPPQKPGIEPPPPPRERPEERPLRINPAVAEQRNTLEFEPQSCSVRRERSHFFVRHYRSKANRADDWQPSYLLPLDFEPAPASSPKKKTVQKIVCNTQDCGIHYTY